MIIVWEQPIMTALVGMINDINVLTKNGEELLKDPLDRRILTEGIPGLSTDAMEYFVRFNTDNGRCRYELRRRPAMTNFDGVLIAAFYTGQITIGTMSHVITRLIEDHENTIRKTGVPV